MFPDSDDLCNATRANATGSVINSPKEGPRQALAPLFLLVRNFSHWGTSLRIGRCTREAKEKLCWSPSRDQPIKVMAHKATHRSEQRMVEWLFAASGDSPLPPPAVCMAPEVPWFPDPKTPGRRLTAPWTALHTTMGQPGLQSPTNLPSAVPSILCPASVLSTHFRS